MSESKPHTVTFRGRINKEEAQEVSVSSLDQSLPAIYQIGSSIDDIQSYVMKDREVNIYPRNSSTDSIKAILYERITEISKRGLACVFDNFSVCANIKTTMKPDEVLFDVCLIIKDFPPFILTFAQPEHVDTKSVVRYNLSLTRKVIGCVRSFTDEPFSALYGVITQAHLKDKESFLQALKDIEKVKSASFVPLSLELPDTKRQQIILALLSSVALTTSVDDEDDLLWFLTLEQFVILTENIDKREVIVRTTPSSGGKVLMREIARRLERSGHTLLVMESKEQIEVARKQKTCSFMLTLEEWKIAKETDLEGLTNMVTNCQDCPPPPGITGKSWTFVPVQDTGQGQQQESTFEAAGELTHHITTMIDTPPRIERKTQENPPEFITDELRKVQDTGQGQQQESTFEAAGELTQHVTTMKDTPPRIERKTQEDPSEFIIDELRKELDSKNKENKKLKDEIEKLKETEDELSRMVDKVSLGGWSVDSGRGLSDTSSVASFGSFSDANYRLVSDLPVEQGATAKKVETVGQGGAKKILKNVKKALKISESKRDLGTIEEEEKKRMLMSDPATVTHEGLHYILTEWKEANHVSLLCAQHEMDRERVNVEYCHVTEDGRLVNTKSSTHTQQGSRRFKRFWGTFSTSPIHLPPYPSSLTPVPPAPQYWETETAVGMKGEYRWLPVMEIGVVEEDMMDRDWGVYGSPHSWCVMVRWCETHKGYCTQVWNQGKHVKCVGDTMPYATGTSFTLRHGVVVDIVRGRVGFVDVDKGVVLEKMDVEFRQTIYPVFGVYPEPDNITVEMRLITGSDVTMTEDKQKLIYSCLT